MGALGGALKQRWQSLVTRRAAGGSTPGR
jgi:hypothetical protein